MPPGSLRTLDNVAARNRRAFVTTHWSLVLRAGGTGTTESREALEELCRKYWHPLYWFARCRGASEADAQDLTQGFFEDLLRRGAITQADATRGRFRTFLLTAFRNFQGHQWERSQSLKRGGGCEIVSLEELRDAETHFPVEPVTMETPEQVFDRKWANSLLEHALTSIEREYTAVGKKTVFDELKFAVWGGHDKPGYAAIAGRLGSTEGAVKVAVHRLRKRFGEELRAEVAKTVDSPDEVNDELHYLLSAIGT